MDEMLNEIVTDGVDMMDHGLDLIIDDGDLNVEADGIKDVSEPGVHVDNMIVCDSKMPSLSELGKSGLVIGVSAGIGTAAGFAIAEGVSKATSWGYHKIKDANEKRKEKKAAKKAEKEAKKSKKDDVVDVTAEEVKEVVQEVAEETKSEKTEKTTKDKK